MTRASAADFYERIADRFEGLDHPADVRRRLSVVFDECLGGVSLANARVLDAGCGYGVFSAAAARRGATVVSVDIGPRLVALARARGGGHGVVADACRLPARDNSFDVVIASEMLEHTLAPARAVMELARVVKLGGMLVITTPNRAWQPIVRLASRLRLRPFQGVENFVGWDELDRACVAAGLDVELHQGFHPWPFHLGFAGAAARVERRLADTRAARLMVNQAMVGRKVRRPRDAA